MRIAPEQCVDFVGSILLPRRKLPGNRWEALRAEFRAQPDLEIDGGLRRTLLDLRRRARALTDLESKLDIPRRLCTAGPYPSAPLTGKWNAIQQGERLAVEERARLGLGRAPVGDLAMLLESQGVRTAVVPLADNISGVTLQERGQDLLILVNPAMHRLGSASLLPTSLLTCCATENAAVWSAGLRIATS